MVDYATWTEIVFEVARDDVSQQAVVSRAAEVWNANKQDLEEATKSEARDFASRVA